MVKKISAIFLALVLCLTAMVVPVSALEDGKTLGLVLRADKTEAEIVPGAVVTVYFHFDLADYDQLMSDMRLCLAYDSSVYTPDPSTRTFLNDLGDYAKDATAAKIQATFGQTCLTAAGATADELALYDGGVMIQIGADVNLGANSKRGFLMTEDEDGVSVAQLSMEFTVTGDEAAIAAGSKNIIWPATIASANQYIKYTDGSSTPKQYATSDGDFSRNNILANMPECEHEADDTVPPVVTDATCKNPGTTEYTCVICGELFEDEDARVEAKPHDMQETEAKVDAKCETEGKEAVFECSYGCGETKGGEVIPKLGHDYDRSKSEANLTRPTETEKGYYTYTCSNSCGIPEYEYVDGADYSAFDEAKEKIEDYLADEDITAEGMAYIMAALQNFIQNNEYVDDQGNIRKDLLASEQAIVDNAAESAQALVDAVEEKIADGSFVKADYTDIDAAIAEIDSALESATISEDMQAELEDIKADLEAFKENANATNADLVNSGLLERLEAVEETMSNCANGKHSFTVYTESAPATCKDNAEEIASCDNGCGATDTREVEDSALGHGNKEWRETTPATCDADGVETEYCLVCGEATGETRTIPALGHNDADGDGICDNGGEVIETQEDCWLTRIFDWIVSFFAGIIETIMGAFNSLVS